MAARKRASAADTKPSPPPQTQETTTLIDPPIAPPKKALIFKFCLFFSIPYFYLLYQYYTIEQELRRSILINASLCVTGFFLTQRMIPVASRYVLKRGLFGFDINKKGTPQGTVKVPESLGIVVGIVFLVLAILFQYFNFTADSN
ncbi:hypothetical protein Gorai_000921, partial [Gossypium raimondii]|nr:hypothetical protein [Gossypium raimondii]